MSAPAGRLHRWFRGQLWWHRTHRHDIDKWCGLLSPSTHHRCNDCDLTWVKSWL